MQKIGWGSFKNLLKNHWANLNQTWHKSSLGENSNLIKWRGLLEIHWNFKRNILPQNQLAKFNQTWYTLSLGELRMSSLFK
jgi:hypothetical protein